MLSQLMSLSRRRLLVVSMVLAGALLAVLLIVLWQVGLFDSAPPPATIESAVESVRQEQEEQQEPEQASAVSTQVQAQQQEDQPVEEDAQSTAASTQQQREDSAADPGSDQDQQTQTAEQDEAVSSADEQEQAEQSQDAEEPQASQQSQPQQTQQSQEQAQQQMMTPESPELSDLAGTWVLSGEGISFVGYRIGEELANIGTTTAVGRTSDVVVSLEFDGEVITSVVIEADLRTLESDQSFRDSALRTRGIETDTYPFATFVLTEAIPIDALPIGEETLSATVRGTLELHGVTNAVIIALEGQYVDGLVVVVGSTEIALADYDIEPPTGFRVLSIDDVGIMEFQLVLERSP